MKKLLLSIILVGFSSAALADNTIPVPGPSKPAAVATTQGCWLREPNGTGRWAMPCPYALPAPPANARSVARGGGCWVIDMGPPRTEVFVDPCPSMAKGPTPLTPTPLPPTLPGRR